MGYTALIQVLMMVLTLCVWRADGSHHIVSNTPTWPTTGCTITRHQGMEPRSGWYTDTDAFPFTITTADECESWCLGEARCGSYRWSTVGQRCRLYQVTPRLLEDLTGIPQQEWMESVTSSNMGSKDCEVVEISPTVCGNYIGHDRKQLSPIYHLLAVAHVPPHNLTAAQCQSMCDVYEACGSALYYTRSSGESPCHLYNTTITELRDSGREDEIITRNDTVRWPILTTYDCVDINECAGSNDCHPSHATCTNTVGSYTCRCNDGYSGDGITCTENTDVKAKGLA